MTNVARIICFISILYCTMPQGNAFPLIFTDETLQKLLEKILSSKEATERLLHNKEAMERIMSVQGGIGIEMTNDLNATATNETQELDSTSQSPITTSSTITKPTTKRPKPPKKPQRRRRVGCKHFCARNSYSRQYKVPQCAKAELPIACFICRNILRCGLSIVFS